MYASLITAAPPPARPDPFSPHEMARHYGVRRGEYVTLALAGAVHSFRADSFDPPIPETPRLLPGSGGWTLPAGGAL